MADGTLKIEKVSPIESRKPATPATHTISYVLDGFPITTQLETAASISDVVSRLKAIGAQPPSKSANLQSSEPTNDAPICEYHGAMKPSKFGGYFCPKKMGDGSHCKSKT
jgi:hypothetical protein